MKNLLKALFGVKKEVAVSKSFKELLFDNIEKSFFVSAQFADTSTDTVWYSSEPVSDEDYLVTGSYATYLTYINKVGFSIVEGKKYFFHMEETFYTITGSKDGLRCSPLSDIKIVSYFEANAVESVVRTYATGETAIKVGVVCDKTTYISFDRWAFYGAKDTNPQTKLDELDSEIKKGEERIEYELSPEYEEFLRQRDFKFRNEKNQAIAERLAIQQKGRRLKKRKKNEITYITPKISKTFAFAGKVN